MSNKEKLLAYAEEMSETDLIFIVNVIEAYKAAERKRREAEDDDELLGPFKDFDEMMEAFHAGNQSSEIV